MKKNNLCKRGAILLTTMLMAVSLYGCGKNDENKKANDEGQKTTVEDTKDSTDVSTDTEDNTNTDTQNSPDYEEVYLPVLEENRDLILNGYDENKDYEYPSTGITENVMYREKSDLMNNLGYVIMDINGDSVPELLLGENMAREYENPKDESYIYAAYTYKDGEIVNFLDGWARNSYMWMGDGNFLYFGSGGAMSSMFGQCHLNPGETELVWDDYYYNTASEDGELAFYHNNTGYIDDESSEKLDVSEEEFWGHMEDYKLEVINWSAIGSDVEEKPVENDSNSDANNDLFGTWLFPNGASVSISKDNQWTLSDDEGNWMFGGNWESKEEDGKTKIRLFSELGDAGNNKVAEGTMYYDPSGYPAMDIEFEKGLTDFTNGIITMSKGR